MWKPSTWLAFPWHHPHLHAARGLATWRRDWGYLGVEVSTNNKKKNTIGLQGFSRTWNPQSEKQNPKPQVFKFGTTSLKGSRHSVKAADLRKVSHVWVRDLEFMSSGFIGFRVHPSSLREFYSGSLDFKVRGSPSLAVQVSGIADHGSTFLGGSGAGGLKLRGGGGGAGEEERLSGVGFRAQGSGLCGVVGSVSRPETQRPES